MNNQNKEKMLELLCDKTFSGLSAAEQAELTELERLFPELKNDDSFEIAASAVSLTNLNISESMPSHLQAKILASADGYFAAQTQDVSKTDVVEYQKTFAFEPQRSSVWQWLGWLVAAFACIVLAVNVLTTRNQPQVAGVNPRPTPTAAPAKPSPAQEREQLLASAGDIVRTNWTDFNPKQPRGVAGDVVWSNSQQKGFIRFSNIPTNDVNKETYQLWIFDENQKQPVDGGVFDVSQGGEVVIPINAKIKVQKPKMFGVTAEKPGGVVVSELGKVMAVAKIEI